MQFLTRLSAIFLLCCANGAVLAQEALPEAVSAALQQAAVPPDAVGIYVQKVDGNAVLLSSNRDVPFSPASTMKLITTSAALELLGPAFTWKTQAFTDGTLRGETLNGDLIIKGSGDPRLVMENLWLFLRRIRAAGIRHIRGNLILDRSAFEERPYDAAAFDNDPLKPYNAGPDALLLNFKSLNLRFLPNGTTRKVRVVMEPPLDGVKLLAPKFVDEDCGDWHEKVKPDFDDRALRFNGVFPSSCGEKAWNVHPYTMTNTQYFGDVFRALWNELDGTFTGEVRNGTVSPAAQMIAEWQSPALSEIVRDINKFSNNVMARQVLLTIPNQVMHVPGTPELGVELVRQWLAKKNIYAPELVIDNGSGLSRTAKLSAATLGRLLVAEYHSPVMPEFIASMPIIGIDGTMKKRMTQQIAAGNGHIKTGALEGVRAIAGYVFAASGNRYAVVFIINDPHAEAGKAAQDALLEWVFENG
jgi:D-alanyl-D-alanine carboxypeptidase/D-alanyl-D-alanine-endopeptidase (penicillin-binding protein 4)